MKLAMYNNISLCLSITHRCLKVKLQKIPILDRILVGMKVSVYSCQQESYPKIGWEFEFPENLSKKSQKHSFILVLVQSGKCLYN